MGGAGAGGAANVCGDNKKDGAEICDGTDLGTPAATCASVTPDPKATGLLNCKKDCTGFDISGCIYCGDGIVNGTETCDDGAANGQYGKCNSTCTGLGPHCGDGIVNGTEMCDDGNNSNLDLCSNTCTVCDPPLTALTKTGAALGDAGPYAGWALGSQSSVEWWVRFTETSVDVNAEMAVSTAYEDSITGGWYCLATTAGISFELRYADTSAQLSAVTSIPLNSWHHVACEYDGQTMRVFLDGAVVGAKTATGPMDSYTGHLLLLLRNHYSSANTTTYAVREIRVGNQALYNGTFSPAWSLAPETGTVALYHATEGVGSSLASATAGAPSVTLTGSTAWSAYGSACSASVCGNGVIEGTETCDDGAANGQYGKCNSA